MTESTPPLTVDVQQVLTEQEFAETEEPPSSAQLSDWANSAYSALNRGPSEITIRLVDRSEITSLNRDYRHLDKSTNVLSFPFDNDLVPDHQLLGDVVICHSVIVDEAALQNKPLHDHYAHMVTHGVLHLCGFDHQSDVEAEQMEALEISILKQSGIANPYN